jgi:putative DNA primase/helicase
LYLEDQRDSFFQAETGRGVRLDVPLVSIVRSSHEIDWLWPERIPFGNVTLIEGAARSGKSFVALDLAARISSGQAWPDSDDLDSDGTASPDLAPHSVVPQSVVQRSAVPQSEPLCLMISRQHTPGDTLGRRLELAGGDPNRVLHLSQFLSTDSKERETLRGVRFPDDLPAIEHLLDKHRGLVLIVIDPLSDFCRAPALMTETVHALHDLMTDRNVAVVATLRATSRFDGRGRLEVKSRWPTDAARCTWFVAGDPDDDSRRLFVPTRTNFCVEPRGLRFSIESGRVVWDLAGPVDAGDPLQNLSASALWLSHLLSEGEVPAKTVFRLGADCGYTPEMLKYAARQLGVHKQRVGFGEGSHSKWSLHPAHQTLVTVRPVSHILANLPAAAATPLLGQGAAPEQSPGVAAGPLDREPAAEASPGGK